MRPRASLLPGLLLAALWAAPGRSSGYVARLMKKTCLECHRDAYGRQGLNPKGEEFLAKGYRYAFDPELTVAGEWGPLSPGGAQMLTRRYRDQGRVIFEAAGVGAQRASCASCHPGGRGLEGVSGKYPARVGPGGTWLTLEGAIARCMVERQGARPLKPGSPSAVGLQLWIRDGLAPAPVALADGPPDD